MISTIIPGRHSVWPQLTGQGCYGWKNCPRLPLWEPGRACTVTDTSCYTWINVSEQEKEQYRNKEKTPRLSKVETDGIGPAAWVWNPGIWNLGPCQSNPLRNKVNTAGWPHSTDWGPIDNNLIKCWWNKLHRCVSASTGQINQNGQWSGRFMEKFSILQDSVDRRAHCLV